MKKSNKLLLGGFLFVVLLITGLHITLYAKYRNGDYTVYRGEYNGRPASVQSFPGISIVSIHDSHAVIGFGNTLTVEKDQDGFTQCVQKGDSLVITANVEVSSLTDPGQVKLILPYNATVIASNSRLTFKMGKENTSINPIVFLNKSIAAFVPRTEPIQLDHVRIIASDLSSATFHGKTSVNRLEVELKNSSLASDEGDIGQLSIATDSTSHLILQAKHLLKAKITTIPTNP